MKRFRITTLAGMALMLLAIVMGTSCSNKTDRKGVAFDTINVITKEDTTRVLEQTKAFMNLLQSNQVDSALSMLSEVTITDSAYNITPETKSRLRKQFQKFPVLSYEIETSQFDSHYKATATYKYKFMENPTEDPNYPCTINLMLKVEYKTGAYRLFLENHAYLTR